MKIRPVSSFLLFVALLLFGTNSPAADFPALGTVQFSFDPDVVQTDLQVEVGSSFQLFLRVDIPAGYEMCGLEGSFLVPDGVTLQSNQWYAHGALDLGYDFSTDTERTFVVGLGECIPAEGGVVLGHWWFTVTGNVENAAMSVRAPGVAAASVSSFDDAGPGWVDTNYDLYLFESPDVTSAVYLNRTSVPTESQSFSEIKALY